MKVGTAHFLVSDVTPWWWAQHWEKRLPGVAMTLDLIAGREDIETISISRDGVKVTVMIEEDEDVGLLQARTEELRWKLDELVDAEGGAT